MLLTVHSGVMVVTHCATTVHSGVMVVTHCATTVHSGVMVVTHCATYCTLWCNGGHTLCYLLYTLV